MPFWRRNSQIEFEIGKWRTALAAGHKVNIGQQIWSNLHVDDFIIFRISCLNSVRAYLRGMWDVISNIQGKGKDAGEYQITHWIAIEWHKKRKYYWRHVLYMSYVEEGGTGTIVCLTWQRTGIVYIVRYWNVKCVQQVVFANQWIKSYSRQLVCSLRAAMAHQLGVGAEPCDNATCIW